MVRRRPGGFTLVEMLVVITIIGILMGLLLPSLSAAREMGRRATCQNNMHQIATACQAHEVANGYFPSGGWGVSSMGQPTYTMSSSSGSGSGSSGVTQTLGFGSSQPGGWLYNILPYLGVSALHDYNVINTNTVTDLVTTPQPTFACPSRRACKNWPTSGQSSTYGNGSSGSSSSGSGSGSGGTSAAHSDYAGNAGSANPCTSCDAQNCGCGSSLPSPPSVPSLPVITVVTVNGNQTVYMPPFIPPNAPPPSPLPPGATVMIYPYFNGVIYQQSQVTAATITDGLANTYLFGERYIDSNRYVDGQDPGDQNSMYVGHSCDTLRWTGALKSTQQNLTAAAPNDDHVLRPSGGHQNLFSSQTLPPLHDAPGYNNATTATSFGSAHPAGFNMAFCDGHVQLLSYSIDPTTHQLLGSRNDSIPVDESKIK